LLSPDLRASDPYDFDVSGDEFSVKRLDQEVAAIIIEQQIKGQASIGKTRCASAPNTRSWN
jgi:hypothetical protein